MTDPTAPPPEPPSQPPSAPVPPDQWRPSDTDRKAVSERLRTAVDEGRLDLLEYDERLRVAETAPTLGELQQVLADLPAPPESVLLRIGEFAVTATTVHASGGPIPLRGCQWTVHDQWLAEQRIPGWAIAVAAVGFFCTGPFSLLFLLVKESRLAGTVAVSVTDGRQQFLTRVPVSDHQQASHVHQQVDYVRSLAAG